MFIIQKKEIGEKASFNLIDLIEENDYVNGHLVHEIEEHSDGYDKELHLKVVKLEVWQRITIWKYTKIRSY